MALPLLPGGGGVFRNSDYSSVQNERAETISLNQLDWMAEAMGGRLVCAIIPREGSVAEIVMAPGPQEGQTHRPAHPRAFGSGRTRGGLAPPGGDDRRVGERNRAGSAEGLLEVSLVLHEPTGVTPLAPDKLQGLKTRHVSTRGELTELEGENIIGVPVRHNSTGMRTCLDDARHWRENGICEPLEATARCHHKLVWVHPFANGNGRWARIMADAYLAPIDSDPFSRLVGRQNTDRRQRPPCAAYPGTAGSGRIREFGPLVELVRRMAARNR